MSQVLHKLAGRRREIQTRISFESCTRNRSSFPLSRPCILRVHQPIIQFGLPFACLSPRSCHQQCSRQIHPAFSRPFGGRANISQEDCLHERVYHVSGLHLSMPNTKTIILLTKFGDGVSANTSSPNVIAESFRTHCDLTSFPFIRRAHPVSKIDFPGTSSSQIQEYGCRYFTCVISRSSPALTLLAEVRQSWYPRHSSEVSVLRSAYRLR